MQIETKEVTCKSLIIRSGLPASNYCINPYVGCAHGCVYCYSRFMKRFTGHTGKWGSFVDVKVNAPTVLRKQLESTRKKYDGTVLLGSVTDAYQPIESRYKITRQLLEILQEYQLNISILTKSSMVTRDTDILTRFHSCEVGVSVSSLEEEFAKRFEPLASPPKKRLDALKAMKDNGISTYVFVGPIFPGLSNVSEIIEATRDYCDAVMAESLNHRCGNWNDIQKILEAYYPVKTVEFKRIVEDVQTWKDMEFLVRDKCEKYGLTFSGFFTHS